MAHSHFREKRKKVIVSPAVHPQYRQVVRTYIQGVGVTLTGDEAPQADLPALLKQLDKDTALFIVQTPNFFGQIEDLTGVAEKVHAAGALLCVVVDPIALGLLKTPGRWAFPSPTGAPTWASSPRARSTCARWRAAWWGRRTTSKGGAATC